MSCDTKQVELPRVVCAKVVSAETAVSLFIEGTSETFELDAKDGRIRVTPTRAGYGVEIIVEPNAVVDHAATRKYIAEMRRYCNCAISYYFTKLPKKEDKKENPKSSTLASN